MPRGAYHASADGDADVPGGYYSGDWSKDTPGVHRWDGSVWYPPEEAELSREIDWHKDLPLDTAHVRITIPADLGPFVDEPTPEPVSQDSQEPRLTSDGSLDVSWVREQIKGQRTLKF